MKFDPVRLLQTLISYDTVTPRDSGIMQFISECLTSIGFQTSVFQFPQEKFYDGLPIFNMYAKIGDKDPKISFAGHTDVVSPGEGWSHEPYSGESMNGVIYGRGAVDMKGAIAAFISAVSSCLEERPDIILSNGLSILITGDEEGIAIHGTKLLLEKIAACEEKLNACIIGEPVSQKYVGDTIKIGARGSITFDLKIHGIRGHVGYNDFADNAALHMVRILSELKEVEYTHNNRIFPKTNLEITHLQIDDHAENVIPGVAMSQFNIRYGDDYDAKMLYDFIHNVIQNSISPNNTFELKYRSSGDAFIGINPDDEFLHKVTESIYGVTGIKPVYNTSGGTSDARFIKKHCPSLEVGLLSRTAHKIDEHVSIEDLQTITRIYKAIIMGYMSA